MKQFLNTTVLIALLLISGPSTLAAAVAFAKQETTVEDSAFQGEYVGELTGADDVGKLGVQVIALGKGKFKAVGYHGGLPGEGWDGEEPMRPESIGQRSGDSMTLSDQFGTATVKNGVMTVGSPDGNPLGTLRKITRESRTLNKLPTEGAIVLFDGKNVDQWENGKLSEDGLLLPGTTSKLKFGSHQLHIEFRIPFQPDQSGQGRGNSGVYVQGRYEVQMLDSFGLEGKDNECGGLYSVKACDLNMCFPPMSWQTFDIEYTAAQYESEKLIAKPRVTVYHNGVKIHDNVELPGDRNSTAAPVQPGPEPGPIYLQDHGNPVRYRNIWVLETAK